jgi:hypothetical protein
LLSPRERLPPALSRVFALHVWIVAALIPVVDRLLTLERMLRLLTPRRSWRRYRGLGVEAIAGFVERRLHRPRQMRRRACLRRSLVLYHFLRLAGIEATFHVAVFPPSVDPKRLHAHSWVTVGPQCISDAPEVGAVEMFTYGAAAETALDRHAAGTRE